VILNERAAFSEDGPRHEVSRWRWRESNPRPKESITKLYERSLPIVVTTGTPAGK